MQVKETEQEKKHIEEAAVKHNRDVETKNVKNKREKDGHITAKKASEITSCEVIRLLFVFVSMPHKLLIPPFHLPSPVCWFIPHRFSLEGDLKLGDVRV